MASPIKQIKFCVRVNGGKQLYKYPVDTWVSDGRLYFKFDYVPELIPEVKALRGARWDPDQIAWHIPVNEPRNNFQLAYLMGHNPYAPYDMPLNTNIIPKTRYNTRKKQFMSLLGHQPKMAAEMYYLHGQITAGEMGTSKTLPAIIAMELATKDFKVKYGKDPEWIYVGPRSAVAAVQREFITWGASVEPLWLTYEGLTKLMKDWRPGQKAPYGVILDEASKAKNENSQRAQACKAIADGIRDDWKGEGYVIELSGSPAPKSPVDWYSLAEIACPGFIKEGDVNKFKRRLGIIVQKASADGGVYPQLVTWRDDERKCNQCGLLADNPVHDPLQTADAHPWEKSVNEVHHLYQRLQGLVSVYFKKDCLDLPEKHYRVIECKPKQSTLRAASLITKTAPTTIQGLTLLRELSDGFQYKDVENGMVECNLCHGQLEIEAPREIPDSCPNCRNVEPIESVREGPFDVRKLCGNHTPEIQMVKQPCPTCGGKGEVMSYRRETQEVSCPKDDALSDILDEHEEVGRIVVFAGFTGSLDRCVRLCQRQGWTVIRMDQGAVKIADHQGVMIHEKDFLSMFQDDREKYPKVAFVAHPKSGGMGLTLTASPTIVYFSNTFDAEDRIQSEDRIHRTGMDVNRGATIIDLIHLPSDTKILDNLKKKRDLQALTLGEFADAIKSGEAVDR